MMSRNVLLTVSAAALLVLLPITVSVHLQVEDSDWPVAAGKIQEVRVRRNIANAGENGSPPRESVDVTAIAEYQVDGVDYHRQLWPKTVYLSPWQDPGSVTNYLVGSEVEVAYDPQSPGRRPPINRRWWLAWTLTSACLLFGIILLSPIACALMDWINPIDQTRPHRRVLTAEQYRKSIAD